MTTIDAVKNNILQLSPDEQTDLIAWMLQTTDNLTSQIRLQLAVKLYASDELTTGLAARLAGVSRSEFFFILDEYNLSPFGVDPEELVQDLANAEQACYHQ